MDNPFTIRVYDRTRKRVGVLDRPTEVRCTPRHNDQGTADFSLDLDNRLADDLTTSGAHVEIDYEGDYLMGGPVTSWEAAGPSQAPTLTVYVADYFERLRSLLAFPNADGTWAGTRSVAQWVDSGPAESVAKRLIAAAAGRLNLDIGNFADQGRGDHVDLVARMQQLADRLFPLIDRAGIGLRLVPTGPEEQRDGLGVDAYVPRTYPRSLSEANGEILSWKLTSQRPTVTRVVIGGGGEDTDRDFRGLWYLSREQEWGTVLEEFIDARDARSDWDAAVRKLEPYEKAADQAVIDKTIAHNAYLVANREFGAVSFEVDVHNAILFTYNTIISVENAAGRNSLGWARLRDDHANRAPALAARQAAILTRLNNAIGDSNDADADRAAAVALRDPQRAVVANLVILYEAELDRRGNVALDEGDATGGAVVEFGETAVFTYGRSTGSSVRVGDRVPLDLAPGIQVTEVIREAQLSWTTQNGLIVTPTVGNNLTDPDLSAARATAALAQSIRNLQARG